MAHICRKRFERHLNLIWKYVRLLIDFFLLYWTTSFSTYFSEEFWKIKNRRDLKIPILRCESLFTCLCLAFQMDLLISLPIFICVLLWVGRPWSCSSLLYSPNARPSFCRPKQMQRWEEIRAKVRTLRTKKKVSYTPPLKVENEEVMGTTMLVQDKKATGLLTERTLWSLSCNRCRNERLSSMRLEPLDPMVGVKPLSLKK